MNEQRKADIQRRLHVASYPRRAAARFGPANNHNPLVLQDCPHCRGTGKRDRGIENNGVCTWTLESCSDCEGTGITGEIEPYFTDDAPETDAAPTIDGWVRCPKCRIKFSTRDPHRWSGHRHLTCGQRIRLTAAN